MFTIINRIFIFIWYQYDIENCYHYNMKFYIVLRTATTSLWCWKKIYNDVTSISIRNWSISRCKSNKKPMSLQYRVSTGLASTKEGSHCVIIASSWLKSNFKKSQQKKRQQHRSKYLLINELFTRKIKTIFLGSSIYYCLPL